MTSDDFHSQLDSHPDDWRCRLVYADWLEEQGDFFYKTQRWMVRNKKRPVYNGFWNWRSLEIHEFDIGILFDSLRRGRLSRGRLSTGLKTFFREYLTRQVAELDLHEALVKTGEIQE